MSRINSVSNLNSTQVRLINRLTSISRDLAASQERLSTLRRINSAADDPSGLVSSLLLEVSQQGVDTAKQNVSLASSLFKTADTAAGEIVTQLQAARSLALEVAGGGLSASQIASKQSELDEILDSINNQSRTEYNGRRLLDGSSGFRTTGVDATKILDLDILKKNTSADVSVTFNVTSTATKAADSYAGGALVADTTLLVTGKRGSTSISLSNGATLSDIASAFNSVTYLTGVSAAVNGGNVDFSSSDYGTAALIQITATQGTFTTTGGGSVTGTNAVATINGTSYTADGTRFSVNRSDVSFEAELSAAASGAIAAFTVKGTGLEFQTGSDPNNISRFGFANLSTSQLGGVSGKLSSLRSGQTNALTGSNVDTAISVIDDALNESLLAQSRIGSFQKYTLESAGRILDSQSTQTAAALSAIRDTDISYETAVSTHQQLLYQSTLQALQLSQLTDQSVLTLFQ